jgi:hypothetical protein
VGAYNVLVHAIGFCSWCVLLAASGGWWVFCMFLLCASVTIQLEVCSTLGVLYYGAAGVLLP